MNINLSVWHSVNASEAIREVFGSGVKVRWGAAVVGEVFVDGRKREFGFEEIHFVQEEHDGFAFEPFAVC